MKKLFLVTIVLLHGLILTTSCSVSEDDFQTSEQNEQATGGGISDPPRPDEEE